jgi:hypothetical protein
MPEAAVAMAANTSNPPIFNTALMFDSVPITALPARSATCPVSAKIPASIIQGARAWP